MSVLVMSQVWQHSEQSGGTLLVLLALADFSNDAAVSWPSVETLAKKARMTDRHVRRILRLLEVRGEVRIQTAKGPGGSNLYQITVRERQTSLPIDGADKLSGGQKYTKGLTSVSARADAGVSQTVREPSGTKERGEDIPIPERLKSPEFEVAWRKWIEYRRSEKRDPVSAAAAKRQLAFLENLGIPTAVASIEISMRCQWTGLFPPKGGGRLGRSSSQQFDDQYRAGEPAFGERRIAP